MKKILLFLMLIVVTLPGFTQSKSQHIEELTKLNQNLRDSIAKLSRLASGYDRVVAARDTAEARLERAKKYNKEWNNYSNGLKSSLDSTQNALSRAKRVIPGSSISIEGPVPQNIVEKYPEFDGALFQKVSMNQLEDYRFAVEHISRLAFFLTEAMVFDTPNSAHKDGAIYAVSDRYVIPNDVELRVVNVSDDGTIVVSVDDTVEDFPMFKFTLTDDGVSLAQSVETDSLDVPKFVWTKTQVLKSGDLKNKDLVLREGDGNSVTLLVPVFADPFKTHVAMGKKSQFVPEVDPKEKIAIPTSQNREGDKSDIHFYLEMD